MAQPTHATTEHAPASGHGGGFPPFKAETYASQLFWLALCFVVLYAMVAKVALPRMAGILTDRRARIDGDLSQAVRLKGDADKAVAAYEKALADARNNAHAIATETRERLARESEAHRKAVEAELADKLAAAETSIAAAKGQAMTNVRGIAVDAAHAIVTQLIGKEPSADATAAAVDRALAR
ncbi:F0F1 ATP synthase subunit B' [Rhodoplanes elegans]|uniref:ATP synthase subunit b n=1 Tax=Rhodoplanes elegans TaxID=29408 RepID=A0A327JWZ8_9BRAD|nr:F0F1 ATP synthase subunit B' [Rhodoplanes elegans]RAI31009.1 F0F1 ATP synthase subunit B' [Rhodoplanes elegans]